MGQTPRDKQPIRQVPVRGSGGTNAASGNKPANTNSANTSRNAASGSGSRPQPSGAPPRPPQNSGGYNSGNSARRGSGSRSRDDDYYDEYDDYDRGGSRSGRGGGYSGRGYGPPPPRNYRNARPRNVQPQRDPFPYIMGGVIGALFIGVLLVAYLLLSNRNINGGAGNPPQPADTSVASSAATAAADTPPRMPMDQFKALYDDPAKRPLILDVRTIDTYDAGHITGAESFPESDVAQRVNELPKDKLIVAYCQ